LKGRKSRMRERAAKKGAFMPFLNPTTVRKGNTKMEKPKADMAHHTVNVPSSGACTSGRAAPAGKRIGRACHRGRGCIAGYFAATWTANKIS
jgi:hypothetical protein